MIRRVMVEKKDGFNVESRKVKSIIQNELNIKTLKDIRLVNCYDVKGLLESEMQNAINNIFSEKNLDRILKESQIKGDWVFRVKALPGQFDQRADSAKQCIKLLLSDVDDVEVEASKIYIVDGKIDDLDKEKIKKYLINPVELLEVSLDRPKDILEVARFDWDNPMVNGFRDLDEKQILSLKLDHGLAMTKEDLLFIRAYFKKENRDPFLTELMVLDTYWSDHCRHTTFNTRLSDINTSELSDNSPILKSLEEYNYIRHKVYEEKTNLRDKSLMDMATIVAKYHLKTNDLDNLDISDEINACSINVKAKIDSCDEDYLIMFKNETHNHPTEIEPFGGASTCLGGAIRDPLSGRAYVYQGMRVSGSADPREEISKTLEGKLPQLKITREAAKGFSSYGNQIGIATGQVSEYYNDGFKAKRMEVGAVIAATPKENVIREVPKNGDLILLIGGKTGRDGVGGATGSSKSHDENSTSKCGAQVQKGNAPEERKLQRLFRNPKAAKMIKRCNDFGAGGVSVAVGELASSIDIFLDRVAKKYDGLNPMEIALSESQERMAVVINPSDLDLFKIYLLEENIEGIVIANVTDSGRLRMFYEETLILDISREFIESSGASLEKNVKIARVDYDKNPLIIKKEKDKTKYQIFDEKIKDSYSNLNKVSQIGLARMFDSSIGSGSILAPFGGKYQKTPSQGMVSKIPTLKGDTTTTTIMTHGYNESLGLWSTYHAAYYSVVESVAKAVSLGADVDKVVLSLQEYFERLSDEYSWGLPVAGLLGSIDAQLGLKVSAIGGKDSMSGTFNDISVPPTIISFAVVPSDTSRLLTPELKKSTSSLYMYFVKPDAHGISSSKDLYRMYKAIYETDSAYILSANSLTRGGALHTLLMMAIGNKIGINIDKDIDIESLVNEYYGAIVVESDRDLRQNSYSDFEVIKLGDTCDQEAITYGEYRYDYDDFIEKWEKPLASIFPTSYDFESKVEKTIIDKIGKSHSQSEIYKSKVRVENPKVLIPIFPGSNCEWDMAAAFEKEGAIVKFVNIRNLSHDLFEESILEFEKEINSCNILALPGGFSAGDEPDGSGKFISVILKNERIKRAITKHLKVDDGLIIGICNGFQALVKTGLLPYGEIRELEEDSLALTYNSIGGHVSAIVNTKITSKKSPWLMLDEFNTNYKTPISHGEGRIVASSHILKELIANDQIASVYTDDKGNIVESCEFNPNGSIANIEGLISPDGRVFGKMAHSERVDKSLYKNITNIENMRIFEAGVKYFKA